MNETVQSGGIAAPAPASGAPAADATRSFATTQRGTAVARVVAAAALIIIGLRIPGPLTVDVGTFLCILLAPCWWPSLRRYQGASPVMAVALLAIASGIWLTAYSSPDHVSSLSRTLTVSLAMFGIAGGMGVVLWARDLMDDARVAQWFAVGLTLGISPDSSQFSANPWKFGFSLAISVLTLALAQRIGKRWLELVVLLALAGISAVSDARSAFAILLLAALLVVWQLRPSAVRRRQSALTVLIGTGIAAAVVFNVGQAAILDGYLGEETQARSVEQLDTSGSLLVGGRPELGATAALMAHHPLGFGSGVIPNGADMSVAKQGMAALGYDPNNNYVEKYLLGGGFELHSLIGDFWANFGIPGLALAGLMLVLMIWGLARSVGASAASAVLLYVVIRTLWNLPFGPLYSSATLTAFALGLVLLRRNARPT